MGCSGGVVTSRSQETWTLVVLINVITRPLTALSGTVCRVRGGGVC